jgi:hypothetical protein
MSAEPRYTTLIKSGSFELRSYEPYTLIEAPDQDLESYRGFRLAFNFIQGENSAAQKIAMTVPVVNTIDADRIQTTAFVMPPDMPSEAVPNPLHPDLKRILVEARLVAVCRFRMTPTMERVQECEARLRAWLSEQGYVSVGALRLARYNPPFIPGVLKRNEVWLDVVSA